MGFGRFGFGSTDDDQPIGFWMDDNTDQAAQRDAYAAAGGERWNASTRSGENLDASRPTDLVALGAAGSSVGTPDDDAISAISVEPLTSGSAPEPSDPASPAANPPTVRYVKAQPGDNITRLAGSSEPGAVGAFARLNGMDGRGSTIYAGRVYAIPTSSGAASPDDVTLGRLLLQHDDAQLAALRAPRAANDQFQTRFAAGRNVWTGQPVSPVPWRVQRGEQSPVRSDWADRLNHNELTKMIARQAALTAGEPIGAARGAAHLGRDAIDTLGFVGRLVNPLDTLMSPSGHSAWQETGAGAYRLFQLGKQIKDDPRIAVNGLRNFAEQSVKALVPEATPEADTAAGEFARVLPIAANRGEVEANIGALLVGGEIVDAARGARLAADAVDASRLMEEYPEATEYWNAPSRGRGSHLFSQNKGKFSFIGGVKVPTWLSKIDIPSPLRDWKIFRLGPEGFTNGEMNTTHALVDPQLYGGRLPEEYGRGWSVYKPGLDQRLPPLGRVWYGASPQLKGAVGAGILGGSVADDYLREWRPQ